MTGNRIEFKKQMLVYSKILKSGRYTILAICDVDLLGKTLREGKIVFEIHKDFYKGLKMSIDEAFSLMEQCAIINMIGPCIISKAIEKGMIHADAVLKISGVPHAQIVKM